MHHWSYRDFIDGSKLTLEIWCLFRNQPCGPHFFRCIDKIAHCNCHISLCNAKKILFYVMARWHVWHSDKLRYLFMILITYLLDNVWIFWGEVELMWFSCVCERGWYPVSLTRMCVILYFNHGVPITSFQRNAWTVTAVIGPMFA